MRTHPILKNPLLPVASILMLAGIASTAALAQTQTPATPPTTRPALPPIPAPLGVPKPGPATDQPYAPQPILQGGIVMTLFPPGSQYLNMDRIREPEQYNMSSAVPGRIGSIVNIHNPSIEVHTVDGSLNTGTVVILAAGGGHNTLNVGSEGADFVPFFYNYGINTVILRNRLRRDGYNPQNRRSVRRPAGDPPGARPCQGVAHRPEQDRHHGLLRRRRTGRAGGGRSSTISTRPTATRPTRWRASPRGRILSGSSIPALRPSRAAPRRPFRAMFRPSFITCAGSGDQGHAVWADEYFAAMLAVQRPESRDAHLRQRPPPRQRLDRRPDRPPRHPLRHLAIPLHRLVPRPGLPAKTRHQNPRGHRRRSLRQPAATHRPPRRRTTRKWSCDSADESVCRTSTSGLMGNAFS